MLQAVVPWDSGALYCSINCREHIWTACPAFCCAHPASTAWDPQHRSKPVQHVPDATATHPLLPFMLKPPLPAAGGAFWEQVAHGVHKQQQVCIALTCSSQQQAQQLWQALQPSSRSSTTALTNGLSSVDKQVCMERVPWGRQCRGATCTGMQSCLPETTLQLWFGLPERLKAGFEQVRCLESQPLILPATATH